MHSQKEKLKSIHFILVIALLLSLSTDSLFAQSVPEEQLEVNLQIRPRAEIRHGLFTPIIKGQESATFIAQRSRLGLVYSKKDKLKIGFTTQIVNVWGNEPQVQVTGNNG